MAACSDQAPTTTSLTAQEVDALQRHQIAALRIISNQKIEAGTAARKLSEKSTEVDKLQKQVDALEQRLFFSGPFKAVAAEDAAARKATSKSRKRTAAERDFDKSHAKMLKDGHMAFKKDAGEQMKGSIQFGCTKAVYFNSKVDPEVFHNMFNDYENFYEGSKQGSPAVYVVRLEREELVAAFGKTRTEKRFRYGGGGTISKMTITYEVATQIAVGAAAWKPDNRA